MAAGKLSPFAASVSELSCDAAITRPPASAAGAASIRLALDLLEARAQFDAPERTVSIRVGEHDGRIYLDLEVLAAVMKSEAEAWLEQFADRA